MNVTMRTAPITHARPDAPDLRTARPLSSDHRFALLTARAGLEPELAKRYTSDPVSVLAEFGLASSEPVYGDADRCLVIEQLDGPGVAFDSCYGCATGMAPEAGIGAQVAFA
ncbi:hypothetical protein [Streptomyces shenzhenensis]|uniref:hypothetical protein n=1 Tax=Streptomyces shenzhenensis TaxID=943815 RepID=UPI0015F11084|nr:hypothetical protein [Streptomyces shenzhenensis]